jgi:hypothetical protein
VKKTLLIVFLSGISSVFAADDSCTYFKHCGGVSESNKSIPSTSASAGLNPGNLSAVKGFGVETILQADNQASFSIVSGTGKLGGGLISPTVENSFFGNRSLEIDEDFRERRIEKKRYKNKKLNLGIGANLYDKRGYGFDLGVSAKRNPALKKFNPGVGFNIRFPILSIGAFIYKDDVQVNLGNYYSPYEGVPYFILHGKNTYDETFTVRTLTIGTKIKKLSLDFGSINTRYKFYPFDTNIQIFSTSYNINKFLINVAYRRESSPNLEEKDGELFMKEKKSDMYYGVQYSFNRHFLVGVGYNTFLLDELSATLSFFL